MNWTQLTASTSYYLEIGHSSLKALNGEGGLELLLERQPNGRLTTACKQKVAASLQGFLKHNAWERRPRLYCAIGARGVSLRRLTLPASAGENVPNLLRLQIENEFPLPPEQLAWGYTGLGPEQAAPPSAPARQDFLVAAVRKEILEDYTELFGESQAAPVFTVGALARSRLCRGAANSSYVLLDIGRSQSEMINFAPARPPNLRTVAWGGENVTRALSSSLGIGRNEAEDLKLKLGAKSASEAPLRLGIQAAIDTAVEELANLLKDKAAGQALFLTGKTALIPGLGAKLAQRLGTTLSAVSPEVPRGEGQSAAILGLKMAESQGVDRPLLTLQTKPAAGADGVARPFPRQWAARVGVLALALLLLPYAEAFLAKAFLARRLAALKADQGRLAMIDRELGFLQYLKQGQPPCLDALYVLSKAAPMGARFDSVSMNRRGELALRGFMHDGPQLTDFRSKLIESGFFANVTVEEQTPTPDRQKLNFRMNAQWKPFGARQALALGPTPEEIEKAKRAAKDSPGDPGGFGPGNPPMGLPSLSGPPPAEEAAGARRASARRSAAPVPPPTGGPLEPPPGAIIKTGP